jgi:hypothetical protein
VNLEVDLPRVTPIQAVEGMRRHFQRPFGRTWVGRQLGRAAWPAFRTGLLDGSGATVAAERAVAAAEHRNHRVLLVARWSAAKIHRVVDRAVDDAVTAV